MVKPSVGRSKPSSDVRSDRLDIVNVPPSSSGTSSSKGAIVKGMSSSPGLRGSISIFLRDLVDDEVQVRCVVRYAVAIGVGDSPYNSFLGLMSGLTSSISAAKRFMVTTWGVLPVNFAERE